jgi:REP element-mobilizing transposase RayT
MNDVQSLNHSKWECKYDVTWIPKYRKKKLYGEIRKYLGEVFKELAGQKECEVLEGHLMADHVHMLISIPPKYAVAQVIGYIKGKSAINIARNFVGCKKKTSRVKISGREDTMCPLLVDYGHIKTIWLRDLQSVMVVIVSFGLKCTIIWKQR